MQLFANAKYTETARILLQPFASGLMAYQVTMLLLLHESPLYWTVLAAFEMMHSYLKRCILFYHVAVYDTSDLRWQIHEAECAVNDTPQH